MTEDTLFAPDSFIRSILEMGQVRRIWRSHQAGLGRMESMIWAFFMLEQWGRNFLRSGVASGLESAPRPGVRPE
jgi:asparagine synthase (glutamine-hydrolysing)